MKPANASAIPLDMEHARQELEAWRSTHRPRCHIPDSFWERAAELATEHGLYLTSRTLRVDYMRLKKRVHPTSPGRKSGELPRLIELMAPTVAGIAECVVELEGAGRRMRIQLKGMGVTELVGLSRMVWSDKS